MFSPFKCSKETFWLLVLIGLGLISALIGIALIWPQREQSPNLVERPTIDSLINIHGSAEKGLKICGRTFRGVHGAPPYYLHVTNSSQLLFAYEPFKGTKLLVVCDTNDCSFQEIPLGNAVFGNGIGYWGPTKGKMGDIVERSSSNRLTLLAQGFRYIERSVLDLNDNTFRIVEVQCDLGPPLIPDFPTNPQSPPKDTR